MKAYKQRFYLTLRQLEKEFNACRSRSDAYKDRKENLNWITLSRQLTLVKNTQP
ncbi:conserved protein of unknown function [Candidatus Nitrosacidococcus tergens]|uniref:Transposase n=1 Tax=Candidatus Nitrosacidococcus tergens TaxID=553981 RepID=A0A7G1QBE0_9GAMM|nr:conserved protein of unknown function [Candidatus Nitrosacidococcus tergens]